MKKFASILITILIVSVSLAVVPTDGLRIWYKMDETSGSVVHDSSGNDFHGTKSSSVIWDNGSAKFTAAYSSLIQPNNATAVFGAFTGKNVMTISLWVKDSGSGSGNAWLYKSNVQGTSGTDEYGSIYCEYPSFSRSWWHMGRNNRAVLWGAGETGFQDWHNYTIVRDGAAMTLYMDGSQVGTDMNLNNDAPYTGITSFSIGGNAGSYQVFLGNMRDFMVYDRALTANEAWFLAKPNPADLNNDRLVNMKDLQILVYDWLDDSLGDSDINEDGVVNFKDYAILLNKWYTGSSYYFDNINGNDNNSGKSPEQAWNSLSKFNNTAFLPGDKIYFKTGGVWTGQLKPKGSGMSGSPIIIDAYGNTDTQAKPRFNGEGTVNPTVYLRNVEYWEVNNLEVTNTGPTDQDGRKGVVVSISEFGTARGIKLRNLYVHDVNGGNNKTAGDSGGIEWFCSGVSVPSRFDGLLIEDCNLVRCDRVGIQGGNGSCGLSGNPWYPSLNVVIRGNHMEDIGGDGIIVVGCDGALVEHNVVNGAAQRDDGACCGIWPWSSRNTVFQYNEVCNVRNNLDGQGFDSDWNCQNSLYQYNYSHNNGGGFILVCNEVGAMESIGSIGNTGTVIRYNISQGDGKCTFSLGAEAEIYNNIVYVEEGTTVKLINTWNQGSSGNHFFRNNIFYADGIAGYNLYYGRNFFTRNVFYGNHTNPPYDEYAITDDPCLISVGSGGLGIDTLDGYKLGEDSICIRNSVNVENNGDKDFWGTTLPISGLDVGAYQSEINSNFASDPRPTNCRDGVEVGTILEWTAGANAVSHNLFAAVDYDTVNLAEVGGTGYVGNYHASITSYSMSLLKGQKYFWRVDAVNGAEVWRGNVWSFIVEQEQEELDPNLIGWWKLDEKAGSGCIAHDSSGYENHGQIGTKDVWGDDCLTFDGGSWGESGIAFSDGDSEEIFSNVSDKMTIAFRFKNDSPTGQNFIYSCSNADGGKVSLEAPGSSTNNLWNHMDGNIQTIYGAFTSGNSNYLFADGNTAYMTFTYNTTAGQMKIYVNGQERWTKTSAYGDISNITKFNIGRVLYKEFEGSLRDFRIYNRVLTNSEIADIANSN